MGGCVIGGWWEGDELIGEMDSFHHCFEGRWVRRARRRQEGQGEEGEVCWRESGRGEEQVGQREVVRQVVDIG